MTESTSCCLPSRTGDPRQRQRLLRHEHLGQLRLPAAGPRLGQPAGAAAEPLQHHAASSSAPDQPLPETQQGHAVSSAPRGARLLYRPAGTRPDFACGDGFRLKRLDQRSRGIQTSSSSSKQRLVLVSILFSPRRPQP